MIQVAGLGASGSYLFRRLADAGFDVTGYDPKKPDFYIPCGYAVNIEKLGELSRNVKLDAGDWLRERPCARRRGIGTKLPFDAYKIVGCYSSVPKCLLKGLQLALTPSN